LGERVSSATATAFDLEGMYKASLGCRLSIALYVKADGRCIGSWRPYREIQTTAYVGLADALRGHGQNYAVLNRRSQLHSGF
jgi:hypothetical protein